MIQRVIAGLLAVFAAVCHAAPVDVNKATQAELESVAAIGPSIADEILNERRKRTFKDWRDLIDRVKGVGAGNAARFSAEGLTVNGISYRGAPLVPKKKGAKKAPQVTTPTAPAQE